MSVTTSMCVHHTFGFVELYLISIIIIDIVEVCVVQVVCWAKDAESHGYHEFAYLCSEEDCQEHHFRSGKHKQRRAPYDIHE
eukprot:CAMPEP_0197527354 /NCGR_PEP_ID=MMETSP1318-20131121/21220_1 /TAXON_ID=552666 /ORGANISM="Partenskyella glossopodia, Strain RCC365" /LENGTH=81 /DNA_ID=CAMNT_0043081943 /DNA_START=1105 /DNA_END=1347 /DNA_ORIENTATION=+